MSRAAPLKPVRLEDIASFMGLCRAARRAARGHRDRRSVSEFLLNLEPEALRLKRALLSEAYHPGPYHRFYIRDPKPRVIQAAPFRDRVVQHALCAALEPHLERRSIHDNYACRVGKGTHAALDRAQRFCRRWPWYLKLDVERFFESLDHEVLRSLLSRLLDDPRVTRLSALFLTSAHTAQGRGLPIGNLTSQHYANLYLSELDHHIKGALRVKGYLRYMDDFVLFGDTKADLKALKVEIARFLSERLKLQLREDATRLAPVRIGLPFLGFRLWPHLTRLDGARVRRLSRKLKALERADPDALATQRGAESALAWAARAQIKPWLVARASRRRLDTLSSSRPR